MGKKSRHGKYGQQIKKIKDKKSWSFPGLPTSCLQSLTVTKCSISCNFLLMFRGYCAFRLSTRSQPYSFRYTHTNVDQYLHALFLSMIKSETLIRSVFPTFYNLDSFPRPVSKYLENKTDHTLSGIPLLFCMLGEVFESIFFSYTRCQVTSNLQSESQD